MKREILVSLFAPLLLSCSSQDSSQDLTAKEITDKEEVTADLSQEELMASAKRSYASGVYNIAIDSFQMLRDNYSPGPYAEFAEVKLADSQYEGREFDVASSLYEEFLKNHPSSPAVPYIRLRAGRSLELSNKGVGRDVTPLERARDHYAQLIDQFPDSVYAGAAREYHVGVIKKLAEYEQMVGEFYKKKEKEPAYLARASVYSNTWEPLLAESQSQLDSAKADTADLDYVPDLEVPDDEPQVLAVSRASAVSVKRKVRGTVDTGTVDTGTVDTGTVDTGRVEIEGPAKVERGEESRIGRSENATDSTRQYKINSVQCRKGETSAVFIYLNRAIEDDSFLHKNSELKAINGAVELMLPSCASKSISANCFADQDIQVTESCAIRIKSEQDLRVMSLLNPARLLLVR